MGPVAPPNKNTKRQKPNYLFSMQDEARIKGNENHIVDLKMVTNDIKNSVEVLQKHFAWGQDKQHCMS